MHRSTAIGKVVNAEVDFVVSNADENVYYQVIQTIASEQTMEWKRRPMFQVRDNYKKIILTMGRIFSNYADGGKFINLVDWLFYKKPPSSAAILIQKYPMVWVLFGTYYYNKLRYFTLNQEKHNAVKSRNIGIYSILPKDAKCKRLDSIPVRVTIIFISKPRNYAVC